MASAVAAFVDEVVARPQVFVRKDKTTESAAACALAATQELFADAVRHQPRAIGPLGELLTEGFDAEQIWEELQLRTTPLLSIVRSAIERPDSLAPLPDVQIEDELEEHDQEEYESQEERTAELSDGGEDDMDGFDGSDLELDEDEDDEGNEDEEEDDEMPTDKSIAKKTDAKKKDAFFDESDMLAFMEEGEQAMAEGRTLLNKERTPGYDDDEEEEDEDDEDVDIYADVGDDSDITYNEFFGDEGSKGRRRTDNDSDEENDEEDDDENDGMDEDDEEDEETTKEFMSRRSRKDIFADEELDENASLTRHERERLRLAKEMRALEMENVDSRPWMLTGEAGSRNRPENSLLEQDLDFDHSRKEAPLVTAAVTLSLEEMIKKRIKDGLWDDVERRLPTNADVEFKPQVEISDEKSKQSLSEVYERAYLEQTNQLKEDSPAEKARARIRGLVDQLFTRLDALTNAHFVPKKPELEVQVVSNVPALVAEEITPAASAGATTRLAPEEIYNRPSRQIAGQSELSSQEKQRLRAASKAALRREKEQKRKDQERIEKSNVGLGNKYSKQRALGELQRGAQAGRVTIARGTAADTTRYTSSSAVFAKLQDERNKPQDDRRKPEGGEPAKKKARTAVQDATKLKL